MRFAGTACAALLAALYLLWDPISADLAAQTFRARIAEEHGFAIYNPYWYGGHHLPGYSLLTPPLFALAGIQLSGAIAAVLATFSFERLAHRYEPAPQAARVAASCWFAVAMVATTLVTGRLTFAVGVALAVSALALLPRLLPAALAGALTGLASPVAAGFLALALAVWAWHSRAYRAAAIVSVAALTPAILLLALFPGGGSFPFVLSSLLPTLAATLVLLFLIPSEHRLLRGAVATMATLVVVSGLLLSPMGGNATRPAALLAGSIAILAFWPGHRRRLILLAPVLLYWTLSTPADDWWQARDDPSTKAAFYAPLKAEIERLTAGAPTRIEVPFTDNHWESAHLPGDNLMLARGWERQLDRKVNGLFYDDRPLTHRRYSRWLHDRAIAFVALPAAPLDYSAADEADLIRSRPAYLREVWRNAEWQLYAVTNPGPLADGAVLTRVAPDAITLVPTQRGGGVLRFRSSPYFGDRPPSATRADPQGQTMWFCVYRARTGESTLRARLANHDLRATTFGRSTLVGCG